MAWKNGEKVFHTVENRSGGSVDFVALFAGVEEMEGIFAGGGRGGGIEEDAFGFGAFGLGSAPLPCADFGTKVMLIRPLSPPLSSRLLLRS